MGLADGRWVEVEEAMRELELFHRSVLPALSHGMCRACADRVKAEFARQFGADHGRLAGLTRG